jgi:hypothetical protein
VFDYPLDQFEISDNVRIDAIDRVVAAPAEQIGPELARRILATCHGISRSNARTGRASRPGVSRRRGGPTTSRPCWICSGRSATTGRRRVATHRVDPVLTRMLRNPARPLDQRQQRLDALPLGIVRSESYVRVRSTGTTSSTGDIAASCPIWSPSHDSSPCRVSPP